MARWKTALVITGFRALLPHRRVFIGAPRLFGVPIRDNFGYWLLARTPNEHWQRWNMLFREWILTFVFFPIMRLRRCRRSRETA